MTGFPQDFSNYLCSQRKQMKIEVLFNEDLIPNPPRLSTTQKEVLSIEWIQISLISCGFGRRQKSDYKLKSGSVEINKQIE